VNAMPEELLARQIAHSDEALSWLLRIEIRCGAAWAEACVRKECAPTVIASSAARAAGAPEGEPSDDERDWRRAWIEIRSRRFGIVPQWSRSRS